MKNTIPAKAIAASVILAWASSWSHAATLIHRYEFNNNLTDSVGAINGTATANATFTEAPSYVAAAPSGAVGPANAISLGQNADTLKSGFSLSNGVFDQTSGSLSLWHNPGTAEDSTADYVIYQPNIGTGLHLYISNPDVANANLLGRIGASAGISASGVVTSGTWINVVLTWDSTGGVNYYVDGSLVGNTTLSSFTTTAGVRFGNFDIGNSFSNLANQYTGYIYDVQSYSGALTSTEVSYLYNNPGQAVPEPGTVAMFGLGLFAALTLSRGRRFK